jgi:hypothetical protein
MPVVSKTKHHQVLIDLGLSDATDIRESLNRIVRRTKDDFHPRDYQVELSFCFSFWLGAPNNPH